MRRAGWSTGVLLVLVLVLARSAAAAVPAWVSSAKIGEGPSVLECPALAAMGAGGEALAGWATSEGFQLATHPPGGSWHDVPEISLGSPSCPSTLVTDARGDAFAMWEHFDGTNMALEGTYRPAGGAWEAPVTIYTVPKSSEVIANAAALNESGELIVVLRATNHQLESRFRSPGGGWGAFQTVSSEEAGPGLGVAMDAAGDVVTAWQHVEAGQETIDAAYRPASTGTWQPQGAISGKGSALSPNTPAVAMTPAGEAVAVFEHPAGGSAVAQASTLPVGHGWGLPVTLSEAGSLSERPQLALDSRGDAVAVWELPVGKETVIQAAWRPAGAEWQPPVGLSAAGRVAKSPHVALDMRGDALAAWTSEGAGEVIQAASRPVAGPWQAPVTLSSSARNAVVPALAADARGDGVAVWEELTGAGREVQAAGFEGTAPTLSGVSVPAAAVAGQPVTFTAAAQGVWTAIADESWSFGDGTAAVSGGTVAHTFAVAGTYQVVFTAIDTVGIPETSSATIVVSPPPAHRPSLTSLRQSHRVWRQGSAAVRIARALRRPPLGTTFSFGLDEPATVTFAFTQPRQGRRAGHRCVRATSHNRRARRCTLTVTRGKLSFAGHQGTNKVAFQGRLARGRLSPGTYTLIASASSSGLASAPERLTFTIRR
jgi:plastocyanin